MILVPLLNPKFATVPACEIVRTSGSRHECGSKVMICAKSHEQIERISRRQHVPAWIRGGHRFAGEDMRQWPVRRG
jgi:hypothetical protein